ncbi:ATP-binding cassette sub-family C member 4-like isoform X2 [Dysidea avara]|uniref:ATP-binding cassette sub-family C member 4-like isoform X2 n=1 Tax=Dysidea avara TaxID=196820 RepID=UPI00331E64A8
MMTDHNQWEYETPAKDPRKEANLISRLFFVWLDPLVWTGYRRELNQEDLYANPEGAKSQKLLKDFKKYWALELRRQQRNKQPRLWFALLRYFKGILVYGIMFYIEILIFLVQSLLVGYLSQYFCEKNSLEEELSIAQKTNDSTLVNALEEEIELATRNAYLFAAGITVFGFVIAVTHAWIFYLSGTAGMKFRVLLTAAIYEKILHLSHSTIGQLSIGHIVNLATNDVQRFDQALEFIHMWWIFPLSAPLAVYLLWSEVGPSCLVGFGIMFLQPPLQYILARLYTRMWLKAAKVTDNRVRVMNEIIGGMRLIKMYAWEWAFHEYVKMIRRKESKIITKASMIRSFNQALFYSLISLLSFATFSTYTALGNVLTPKKVFTVITVFAITRIYYFYRLVNCLLGLSDMWVASKRIQNLLLLPELSNNTITYSDKLVNEEVTTDSGDGSFSNGVTPRIIVNNLTASWTHAREKVVLEDINFTVDQSNRLLAVVGPVGSGKSSILQCLLRELEALDGSVDIEGSVSYASQDPWIFSGTVKENILFGKNYDEVWYKKVVECCSLIKDIDEMPIGNETLIGERGVNLSGGQKARVNLARTVYRDSDIMLLDDPLSAVDAAVSRHLFDKCICGVLADKLVILVTHQLQYAEHADCILVLKEGCVQGYGNYEELTSTGLDPTELFDDVMDNLVSPNLEKEEHEDVTEKVHLDLPTSPIDAQHLLVDRATSHSRQLHSESSAADEMSLHTVPSMFSLVSIPSHFEGLNINTDNNENKHDVMPEEERAHGTISNKTYLLFAKEGGGSHLITIALIVLLLAVEGSVICTDWWLANWASEADSCLPDTVNISTASSSDYNLTTDQRVGIYGGLVGVTTTLILSRAVLCYLLCFAATSSLHSKMFKSILRTPILFFDTNPVGRVLNRFSKDIGFMDALLPNKLLDCITLGLRLAGVFVTACVANYWLSILVTLIVVSILLFRHYFLYASRNIQRLEALARSPVYSHISSTIQGLSIIRAYKEQSKFLKTHHFYQNEHTKAWYLKVATIRWFGMRLDILGAVFIMFVVFTSIPLADVLDPALVGLSLAYAATVSAMLQYAVRLSAEVESLMVSVERVMAYGQLESEAELETIPHNKAPRFEWPDKGVIELHNTKFKYAVDHPYVLKSISFRIESCEKVGIVGRTGAGKSSLLAALFRLAEPEGVFEIDGIQITDIGLHDLRKRISIIPQDPVLFSGTVRYNLDPFNELADHQLWDALEEVQLREVVMNLEDGLEAQVFEGGSNFSVGQRQLMCLARSLLRRNKILVIDEATANVDLITDGIIQEMIRKKFNYCTILTIAHRLETIMDSDRVLVLSSGKVIEFDTPYNLLQKQHSTFHSMIKRTGPVESERLKDIARTVEKLKHGSRL